jgi:Protein of unknwon function (DUF3310)
MPANDRQVNGDHYKSQYQHWDLVILTSMGYLAGNSTKYVARWRKKNGIEDLKKAKHYLEKLIEVRAMLDTPKRPSEDALWEQIRLFTLANRLTNLEQHYIYLLCSYKGIADLKQALDIIGVLIRNAQEENYRPGTPEDGGHHARLPENNQ